MYKRSLFRSYINTLLLLVELSCFGLELHNVSQNPSLSKSQMWLTHLLSGLGLLETLCGRLVRDMRTPGIVSVGGGTLQPTVLLRLALEVRGVVGGSRVGQDVEL